MIDQVDAVSEPVGEHNILSLQTERLNPHRRQQEMWKDGHAAFAEEGFSLTDSSMNESPSKIQKNSRTLITTPRYTPRSGGSERLSRPSARPPSRAPRLRGIKKRRLMIIEYRT